MYKGILSELGKEILTYNLMVNFPSWGNSDEFDFQAFDHLIEFTVESLFGDFERLGVDMNITFHGLVILSL